MVIIIGAGLDYVAVSAELEFSRGSVRECHTVQLIQDEDCELPLNHTEWNCRYVGTVVTVPLKSFLMIVVIDCGMSVLW